MKLNLFVITVLIAFAITSPCHSMQTEQASQGFQAFINKQENEGGMAALHGAAADGHPEIVKTLVDNGASQKVQLKSLDEFYQQLIAHKQPANITENNVRTLIHIAKSQPIHVIVAKVIVAKNSHHHEKIKTIITYLKSTINDQQEFQMTPLYIAAYAGKLDICQHLVNQGAQVDLCNILDEPPLFESSTEEVFEYLYLKMPQNTIIQPSLLKETILHYAVKSLKTKEALLKDIIEKYKQSINNQTKAYSDMLSIINSTFPSLTTNLSNEIPHIAKATPLHYAVIHNNPLAVQLLLKHGADKSIKNENNETPLELAQKQNPQNQNIINMLTAAEKECGKNI